jgi:hypothetical protein
VLLLLYVSSSIEYSPPPPFDAICRLLHKQTQQWRSRQRQQVAVAAVTVVVAVMVVVAAQRK